MKSTSKMFQALLFAGRSCTGGCSGSEYFALTKCCGISKSLLRVGIVLLSMSGWAAPVPKFVYVTNDGSISAYSIDAASGALTPVPGSPFAADSPRGVAVDPSGKFVYVANILSNNVSAYAINASSGALTPVPGSPFAAGNQPYQVAVDPSGKFVYVTNYIYPGNVSAYSINAASGALTPVPGSPFAAGPNTGHVAVDPSGKFAYVANAGFPEGVSAYTINASSGALTLVPGSPFEAGCGAFGVAVDPSGSFAYVASLNCSNVSAYTINAADGALTPVPGSPFAAGTYALGVAVDPSGKFVYVANNGSNNVSAYSINAASGALTAVPGSPFAAGCGVYDLAVDPSGKFVYVPNYGSGVCAYTINAASGALTPVPGSPFAAGNGPLFVAVAGTQNQPPVANAGPDQTVIVGEVVTFDGSGSYDPDGTIASFDWDFGDNTTGSGTVATKAYSTAGVYSVVLTVTDDMGASSTDTATVTVLTAGQAIQSLASIVQSFNLQQGITNSLDAKIQNALDAMSAANAGARSDAANKLSAFINSVEAQRGKQLTNAQADTLEALARRILGLL